MTTSPGSKIPSASYTSDQDPRINELLKAIRKPITEDEATYNAGKIVEIMSQREVEVAKKYFIRGSIVSAVVVSLMFISF